MNSQVTFVERRHRARTGILAELEDITYNTLRKYGIDGSTAQQSASNTVEEGS